MGALKDEAAGGAKKVAGKLTGNEELRQRGEAQEQKGIDEDQAEQARRLGGSTLEEPETHEGSRPGDGPSGMGDT